MVSYLEMLFRNQAGQLVTISIIDPRPDITPGEVEAVMDTIIARIFSPARAATWWPKWKHGSLNGPTPGTT